MNGPTKKKGLGIGGWEIAITIAGLTVVIGLLMESGSEIRRSWILHRWPPRELWGAVLVAVGVFAEVVIGIFIARSSKREQIESNERIAQAEKEAAAANLARIRIEEKFRPRKLNPTIAAELVDALREFAGVRIDLFVFDEHLPEVRLLGEGLFGIFQRAGCKCKYWAPSAGRRVLGDNVSLAIAQDATPEEEEIFKRLKSVIVPILSQVGLKFSYSRGGFKKTDPMVPHAVDWFTPWDPEDVAGIRIQIVEKSALDNST